MVLMWKLISRIIFFRRGGEDEYLAQEKHRFSSSSAYNQSNTSSSGHNSGHNSNQSSPPHPHTHGGDFKLDSSQNSSGFGLPSGAKEEPSPPGMTLPSIHSGGSVEKGTNISPLSARRSEAKPSLSRCTSKDDVYANIDASTSNAGNNNGATSSPRTSGRFPPIVLNRGQSGGNLLPTHSRTPSGGNLLQARYPSGSNLNREDKAGDDMDVDSPPKYGKFTLYCTFLLQNTG